jgi:hypothetical protein
MRQFYREFPKWNAVRSELSWTHYRMLMKVEKENSLRFSAVLPGRLACPNAIHRKTALNQVEDYLPLEK